MKKIVFVLHLLLSVVAVGQNSATALNFLYNKAVSAFGAGNYEESLTYLSKAEALYANTDASIFFYKIKNNYQLKNKIEFLANIKQYYQQNNRKVAWDKEVERMKKLQWPKSCTVLSNGIEDNTYTYDMQGNVLEHKSYDKQGNLLMHVTNSYNASDLKITEMLMDVGLKTQSKTNYFYDDLDKKVKEVMYKDGKLSAIKIFTYNKQGFITTEKTLNAKEVVVNEIDYMYNQYLNMVKCTNKNEYGVYNTLYTYDEVGNLVSELGYDSNDELVAKTTYKFNEKGNVIENIDENYFEQTLFTYNSNGYIAQKILTQEEPYILYEEKYSYNSFGNILEKKKVNGVNGQLISVTNYTYDTYHNLKSVITKNENNHVIEHIVNTYTYAE